MKKSISTLFIAAATLMASNASAVSFWQTAKYFDLDIYGDNMDGVVLTDQNSSVNGEFDITPGAPVDSWDRVGFDSSTETITAAEVVFLFIEESVREKVKFNFDDFAAGNYAATFTTLNFGGGSLLLDVDADGKYAWTIALNDIQNNSNVLLGGYLAADTRPVPDTGTTSALLGLSILGLAVFRRRR